MTRSVSAGNRMASRTSTVCTAAPRAATCSRRVADQLSASTTSSPRARASCATFAPMYPAPRTRITARETTAMDYEHLRYEHDGHVVTLTYDRPDQHNAICRPMARELHDAWRRFRDDEDAFVLVITGAGETTFCAGWDLQDASEMEDPGDWDAFRVALWDDPGPCGYTRRTDVFKPVIAA